MAALNHLSLPPGPAAHHAAPVIAVTIVFQLYHVISMNFWQKDLLKGLTADRMTE